MRQLLTPMSLSRQTFLDDLKTLEQQLVEMASLAEKSLALAVESLTKMDAAMAHEAIESDDEIDRIDLEIEHHCLRILALQQPMATDLRIVGTCMKMITDIERVGDLAVDIAKITLKLQAEMGDPSAIDIPRMATLARRMLRESTEAFVKRDLDRVTQVVEADEEMDSLFRDTRSQLHDLMRKHPDRVVEASWMLLAIHHLERVGDHATNIAERVYFMETGRLENLSAKLKSAKE